MFSTMHNSRYFVFLKVSLGLKISFDIQACDCIGIWLHWAHRADPQSLRGPSGSMTQSHLKFWGSRYHTYWILWLKSCSPGKGVIPPTMSGPMWADIPGPLYWVTIMVFWIVYPCEQLKDKSEKINYLQKPYNVVTKTPFRCSERVYAGEPVTFRF